MEAREVWKKKDLGGERPTLPAAAAEPTAGERVWEPDPSAAPAAVRAEVQEAEDGREGTG